MSDTGKLNPRPLKPGTLKSKFIVPGAITGVRVVETGDPDFRITEDGTQFRKTEDQ